MKARGRRSEKPTDEQLRKFQETARELACDEDVEMFRRAVQKLAKLPPTRRMPVRAKKDRDKPD